MRAPLHGMRDGRRARNAGGMSMHRPSNGSSDRALGVRLRGPGEHTRTERKPFPVFSVVRLSSDRRFCRLKGTNGSTPFLALLFRTLRRGERHRHGRNRSSGSDHSGSGPASASISHRITTFIRRDAGGNATSESATPFQNVGPGVGDRFPGPAGAASRCSRRLRRTLPVTGGRCERARKTLRAVPHATFRGSGPRQGGRSRVAAPSNGVRRNCALYAIR